MLESTNLTFNEILDNIDIYGVWVDNANVNDYAKELEKLYNK